MSWLDRLPPAARHAVILCLLTPAAIAISVPATAVLSAGGISTADCGQIGTTTLDAVTVSLAGGALSWVALVLTPLTRAYGIGSQVTGQDTSRDGDTASED